MYNISNLPYLHNLEAHVSTLRTRLRCLISVFLPVMATFIRVPSLLFIITFYVCSLGPVARHDVLVNPRVGLPGLGLH